MKKKRNIDLSKEEALQIIRKYLMQKVLRGIKIQDGMPEGLVFYGVSNDRPCWTVYKPPEQQGMGPGHYICICKKTGKIIFDGLATGE